MFKSSSSSFNSFNVFLVFFTLMDFLGCAVFRKMKRLHQASFFPEGNLLEDALGPF